MRQIIRRISSIGFALKPMQYKYSTEVKKNVFVLPKVYSNPAKVLG